MGRRCLGSWVKLANGGYFTLCCKVLLLGLLPFGAALAQVDSDSEAQWRRAEQQALELQRQLQAPDIRSQSPAPPDDILSLTLPVEQLCFQIHTLRMESTRADAFGWVQEYLTHYAGLCIGREGINAIVRRVSALIIQRGYITTRMGIPEQDLKNGVLRLVLVPGVIRKIRFADNTVYGTWWTAFPASSGDLLNLRALEQGLEQMKRVPMQDVDMQIVPAIEPGESDIVIGLKREAPWRLLLSLDDSGAKATGELQAALSIAVDNPLGLSDLLNISVSNDAHNEGIFRGTHAKNFSYSMPFGYWTFSLSGGAYQYHQTVKGRNETFLSQGDSRNAELKIHYLLHRNQTHKTALQLRTSKRYSKSYIDDTEIEVQRRNVASAELALIERIYIGQAKVDFTLAHREGAPWFNSQVDLSDDPPGTPTFRYKLETFDVVTVIPIKFLDQPILWVADLRGQYSDSSLYGSELFAIGNRYTVRGFDAQQSVAAERGWYLRNDVEFSLSDTQQVFYVGIDYGRVYGPSTEGLLSSHLAGQALGLRGSTKGFSYDLFLAWPLMDIKGYEAKALYGFQFVYQY